MRAKHDSQLEIGQVFAPMHWSNSHAARAKVNTLLAADTDEHSGEPAFKNSLVEVHPSVPQWSAVLLSTHEVQMPDVSYWIKVRMYDHWQYLLADDLTLDNPEDLWHQFSGNQKCLRLLDPANGVYRFAQINKQGKLGCVLFIAPDQSLTHLDWIGDKFSYKTLTDEDRSRILEGHPPRNRYSHKQIICSCNRIDSTRIENAISEGAHSVSEVTQACKAGGTCGSCIPEIQRLIDQQHSINFQRTG